MGKKEAVVRKNGRSGSMSHGNNNNKGQKNNESFVDNKQCQGVILEGI